MSFRNQMAHEISRRNFLKGTAAGALSLAVGAVLPSVGKTKAFAEDVTYVPGTYTATATGMGTVKVEVTFDEKSITDIVLDVSGETPDIGQKAADTLKEQVLAAQSGDIDGVSGASLTSGAVREAVNNCIAQARGVSVSAGEEPAPASAGLSWENPPAPIPESEITATYDYEVVVIGAGVAGNSAAEGAASQGAKTALIEQSNDLTAHGCDNACIDSKFQKELGIEFDRDEIFKLLYRWSQQEANPVLIRTWIDRSGEVFDHFIDLADKYGIGLMSAYSNTSKVDWEDNDEWFREYRTAMSFGSPEEGIIIDFEKFQFLEYHLVEMLAKEAQACGAEYFFNTRAQQLVKEGDRVTGVICTDENGNYVKYNASKGVILATGDFGGNPDMVKVFCPISARADSVTYFPANGNLGDGINMACWVGAAVSKSKAAPAIHPISNSPLTCLDMSWLGVNKDGVRFCAEVPFEPYVTNARMNQPGNIAWNIFDSKYEERVMKQEPNSGAAILEAAAAAFESCKDTDLLVEGATLDELAEKLGIPAETFKATVARYNEMCASGADTDFGVPERFLAPVEEGPFYAVPMPATVLAIPFGVHVDKNSQVCTENDEPIGGLFAVGNAQGDFFANSYPVFCPGLSHGRALTFGSLVGQALAHNRLINE